MAVITDFRQMEHEHLTQEEENGYSKFPFPDKW